MIISRKIMAQWLDISKIKDEEIALALNNLGFEVEQKRNLIVDNTNLVVGQIVKIVKHPQANKLNICDVNIGNKIETIICGAANVAVGIKVVVAKIDSKLANGLTIVAKTIQNVVSRGMICSLSEVGVADGVQDKEEVKGIIHLPDEAIIGNVNPLQYLNLDDTIFIIDVTVNRSDCLGIYSIAKELSIYFRILLKNMEIGDLTHLNHDQAVKFTSHEIRALATLKIRLNQNITDLTPAWIRRTLQLANIIPTILVEDINNLVMLELGQPLLIFNGDVLKEPSFRISPKSYPEGPLKIQEGDILIHDKYLAFSVLGISLNLNYKVNLATKNIVIFSINPDPYTMNQQFKRHGVNNNLLLQRLTKPIVPDYYLIALQRYLFILNKLNIKYEVIGFNADIKYEPTTSSNPIVLNYHFINTILGINLEKDQIRNYLTAIGCQVEISLNNQEVLEVIAPFHRNDLNNPNDLSEEIARVIGYNNDELLPAIMPQFHRPLLNKKTTLEQLMLDWKNHLLSYGFNQVKTYNLTSSESLANFNFFNYKIPIKLQAPLTSTREVMRFSLIESLLSICQYNCARKQSNFKLFTDEVIYTGDEADDQHHLAFIINGDFLPKTNPKKTEIITEYQLVKGFIDEFFHRILGNEASHIVYKANHNLKLHPYLSADIFYKEAQIAIIGPLHPQVENQLNLENVFLAEINCSALVKIIDTFKHMPLKFKSWPKFNPLSRDISIFVKNNIQFLDIKNAILAKKVNYLDDIVLNDFYIDEKLKSQNQHALTLNFKFNSSEAQLDENKISIEINIIQQVLKEHFKAVIR